jgi:hypothetical protein
MYRKSQENVCFAFNGNVDREASLQKIRRPCQKGKRTPILIPSGSTLYVMNYIYLPRDIDTTPKSKGEMDNTHSRREDPIRKKIARSHGEAIIDARVHLRCFAKTNGGTLPKIFR